MRRRTCQEDMAKEANTDCRELNLGLSINEFKDEAILDHATLCKRCFYSWYTKKGVGELDCMKSE
jgi:hypothetical protein